MYVTRCETWVVRDMSESVCDMMFVCVRMFVRERDCACMKSPPGDIQK